MQSIWLWITHQNKMAAPKLGSVLSCDERREETSFMSLHKNYTLLTCICKAAQWEMLGCLWASYLRAEPGKSCCSHSRFQWSELLSAAAGHERLRMFSFLKHLTRHCWAQWHCFPSAVYKDYFSCSPFSFPPPFISSFLWQFLTRRLCRVWFSSQCQAPPGQPESSQQRAKHPALPRRRWWGRFALITLINSLDAVE